MQPAFLVLIFNVNKRILEILGSYPCHYCWIGVF